MNDQAPATAVDREGVCFRGDGYRAEAGWFGPEDRPRFGWLYRPDTPAANGVGIVIVPPFGREYICSHRTLRHLAEQAACAGFTAARFDLDGAGDSAGDDTDPGRVEAWLASIHDACDLARGAGARQLLLVGVRLGATLATLAAAKRADVAALIAFNAVISGKAYLRELRAFQVSMNLQPSAESQAEPGQETSGFLLTEATCATLQSTDLARTDACPAPIVLVLERDDLPERKTWPEHLRSLGATVETQRTAGYATMLDDPHRARVAQDFIAACIGCGHGLAATRGAMPPTMPPTLRPRVRTRVGDTTIVEAVVTPGTGIFGILAGPAEGNAQRAVLMLNAGAIRHIGSNRTDVMLARQLAAQGLQVLRADLTGIGDSPARAGDMENVVYGPHALQDVGMMVAWLRARGVTDLVVGGMCSGAYHALRAAIAGHAIDGVYLVNCGVFGPTVEFDPDSSSLFGDINHYNEAMKSTRAWWRLLTGKVAFGAIVQVAAWYLANGCKRVGKGAAHLLHIPLRNDLGSDLLALARRDVRVHFLFSANDPGRTVLAAEAGSVVLRLRRAGKLTMRIVEGADHTFTQRWAQKTLRNTIESLLAPSGERG